jgi:hypothetical protein
VQLDRGKWRQGSDEEEDEKEKDEKEKEGAYSFASPIPWEDLADEGEPAGGDAPREPTETNHPASSEPFDQKEGLKRHASTRNNRVRRANLKMSSSGGTKVSQELLRSFTSFGFYRKLTVLPFVALADAESPCSLH